MIKWEYRILTVKDWKYDEISYRELNELGNDGWEIISSHFSEDGSTSLTGAVFKRPLKEEEKQNVND